MVSRRMFAIASVLLAIASGLEALSATSPSTARQPWVLPVEGAARLSVLTAAGDIRVMAWEKDRIEIRSVRTAGEAAPFPEEMRLNRRREADGWVVKASWPETGSQLVAAPRVTLEIRLPAGMRVAARTGHGDIRIEGSAAAVEAETQNGSIEIRQADRPNTAVIQEGALELEVAPTSGEVDVRATGGTDQDLRLQSGSFRVSTRGPIHIRTSRGALHVRLAVLD